MFVFFLPQQLLDVSKEISKIFSTIRSPKLKRLEFGWRRIANRIDFLHEFHFRNCRTGYDIFGQYKSESSISDFKESLKHRAEATLEISNLISNLKRRIQSTLSGGLAVHDDGKTLGLALG
jgi:hypothetical protein